MRILRGKEIPITICISYTIISMGTAILELCMGLQKTTHINSLAMLVWTSIAVLVLSIHYLFDSLPPILMIVLQYLIAMGLVLLSVFLFGLFDPVEKDGYRDIFLSFTIPYLIGAIFYYVSVFTYAGRQNKLLEQIQKEKK